MDSVYLFRDSFALREYFGCEDSLDCHDQGEGNPTTLTG